MYKRQTKPNLQAIYPFIDAGVVKEDVFRMLEESGLGAPEYYEWRSRSGCYFCFFQQRREWVGLKERHPDLYEKAKEFEKFDEETGRRFTWSQKESLEELEQPERMAAIKETQVRSKDAISGNLSDILADEEEEDMACLVCQL